MLALKLSRPTIKPLAIFKAGTISESPVIIIKRSTSFLRQLMKSLMVTTQFFEQLRGHMGRFIHHLSIAIWQYLSLIPSNNKKLVELITDFYCLL